MPESAVAPGSFPGATPNLPGTSPRGGITPLRGELLYLLEPLLKLLGRTRVSERPRQIFYVLFVGTHENERLFEGHVFESGQRQSRYIQGVLYLGFLAHSVHTSRLDEQLLVPLRLGCSAPRFVDHLSPLARGTPHLLFFCAVRRRRYPHDKRLLVARAYRPVREARRRRCGTRCSVFRFKKSPAPV